MGTHMYLEGQLDIKPALDDEQILAINAADVGFGPMWAVSNDGRVLSVDGGANTPDLKTEVERQLASLRKGRHLVNGILTADDDNFDTPNNQWKVQVQNSVVSWPDGH